MKAYPGMLRVGASLPLLILKANLVIVPLSSEVRHTFATKLLFVVPRRLDRPSPSAIISREPENHSGAPVPAASIVTVKQDIEAYTHHRCTDPNRSSAICQDRQYEIPLPMKKTHQL